VDCRQGSSAMTNLFCEFKSQNATFVVLCCAIWTHVIQYCNFFGISEIGYLDLS